MLHMVLMTHGPETCAAVIPDIRETGLSALASDGLYSGFVESNGLPIHFCSQKHHKERFLGDHRKL